MQNWTPKQIVDELDRYIIGQEDAKRAVAVALRNRYRRRQLDPEMQVEITPKNIIMMGPTGCGKTEIARRLARLVEAPFIKVEATKFTEVGYVGRDVESIIRDLVEASIHLVKTQKQEQVQATAAENAEKKLVKLLVPVQKKEKKTNNNNNTSNPLEMLFGATQQNDEVSLSSEEKEVYRTKREHVAKDLEQGRLEETMVEVDIEETQKLGMDMGMAGAGIDMSSMLGDMMPKKRYKRKCKVSDARKILIQQECDRMIDMDEVIMEALEKAEQDGIVFIDEIDKIAERGGGRSGPDVSREGVQRDILPIVEGSTVNTKYGPVKTDYILFIAAGAFHTAKITDLIPELQGRFPIHVELNALTKDDFVNILRQTDNAITKQYAALLSADNINLIFQEDALEALAIYSAQVNEQEENIGARRLHTVMELLLQDISFNASGDHPMIDVVIDQKYVEEHIGNDIKSISLQKYVI